MGLFDGFSLKSAIRDVTNVVGSFTGARPIQYSTVPTGKRPVESSGNIFDERIKYFGEILPGILESLPVFNQQPATEIKIELPSETKESGQMENGPQVYQGAAGAVIPFAQQLGRTLFGGGAGGAIGGAIGGALIGQGVQQFMGTGDACGCGPKPFVRLDKCGRPIITRAMQKQAKDMVMCMGIEGAAAALGIDVPLLAQIAFKKFKPRARGISGAQLKTAQRVNNKVMHMAKKLEASCKRPAMRRR